MGGLGAVLKQTKQGRPTARHQGLGCAGSHQLFLNGGEPGMLLEDNIFKIVHGRTETPLPPHLRLETSNFILL
jgi:hypothetical protein